MHPHTHCKMILIPEGASAFQNCFRLKFNHTHTHIHTVRCASGLYKLASLLSTFLTSLTQKRGVLRVQHDGWEIKWVLAVCRCVRQSRRKSRRRIRRTPGPHMKYSLVLDGADETQSLSVESQENSCRASHTFHKHWSSSICLPCQQPQPTTVSLTSLHLSVSFYHTFVGLLALPV